MSIESGLRTKAPVSSAASGSTRWWRARVASARRHPVVFWLVAIFTLLVVVWLVSVGRDVYLETRPSPSLFRASVHSRGVSFAIGDWPGSAGIFNSDTRRVDVTLIGETTLSSDDGQTRNCTENASFRNVRLTRIATPAGLRIALGSVDGGIRYNLSPPDLVEDPFFTLAVDGKSDRRGLACLPEKPFLPEGEWRVQATEAHTSLEFVVRFLPPQEAATGGRISRGPAQIPVEAPQPETDIPLASGTNLALKSDLPEANAKSQLRMVRDNRVASIFNALDLRGLSNASIETLSYDPKSSAFGIAVAGSASDVSVRVADQQFSENESKWNRLRSSRTFKILARIGALLTALGGIPPMLWEIGKKFFPPEKKKRSARKNNTTKTEAAPNPTK